MTATPEPALAGAYAECERLVRETDPDRAVSVAFAPPPLQPALFALYAFYGEAARVRDHVSQPMPGEIRLQWWRDRIAGAEDAAPTGEGAPVAEALADTIRRHRLPADAFDRMLEARIFDLYDDPMPSRTDFEAYAGETASALIMLAAMVLDRDAAPTVADVAGHAGVGQEAVRRLARARFDASRHQIFVPGDILAATGVASDAWLRGDDGSDRAETAMAAFAEGHWSILRDRWTTIPRPLRPAFLPALLAGRSLPRPSAGPPSALSRLWFYWRAMRR